MFVAARVVWSRNHRQSIVDLLKLLARIRAHLPEQSLSVKPNVRAPTPRESSEQNIPSEGGQEVKENALRCQSAWTPQIVLPSKRADPSPFDLILGFKPDSSEGADMLCLA